MVWKSTSGAGVRVIVGVEVVVGVSVEVGGSGVREGVAEAGGFEGDMLTAVVSTMGGLVEAAGCGEGEAQEDKRRPIVIRSKVKIKINR